MIFSALGNVVELRTEQIWLSVTLIYSFFLSIFQFKGCDVTSVRGLLQKRFARLVTHTVNLCNSSFFLALQQRFFLCSNDVWRRNIFILFCLLSCFSHVKCLINYWQSLEPARCPWTSLWYQKSCDFFSCLQLEFPVVIYNKSQRRMAWNFTTACIPLIQLETTPCLHTVTSRGTGEAGHY